MQYWKTCKGWALILTVRFISFNTMKIGISSFIHTHVVILYITMWNDFIEISEQPFNCTVLLFTSLFTTYAVCTICFGKLWTVKCEPCTCTHSHTLTHRFVCFLISSFIWLLLRGHLANFHNRIEIRAAAGKCVIWWSAWQRENGNRADAHHCVPLHSIVFHCSGLQRIIMNYQGP